MAATMRGDEGERGEQADVAFDLAVTAGDRREVCAVLSL
jgi:hypothetical protein